MMSDVLGYKIARIRGRWVAAAAVLTLAGGVLQARVRMPHFFSNNMVLQRDMQDPIWGTADPGEKITVRFAGKRVTAVAGSDGRWMARLSPLHADAKPRTLVVAGRKHRIRLTNVLVGDVWLCSGQSNMQFPVDGWWGHVLHARREVAAADHPLLRLLKVPRDNTPQPRNDFDARWMRCTPATIKSYSAVAYFFGRDLDRHLRIPIGLIDASYGGTVIQSWTPMSALRRTPALHADVEWFKKAAVRYRAELRAYHRAIALWQRAAAADRRAGKTPPAPPKIRKPVDPFTLSRPSPDMAPASIFHAMIHPLIPMSIKGVVWYQGENNAWINDSLYGIRLRAMIRGWRRDWHLATLPIILVQIAPYFHYPNPAVGEPLVWLGEQDAVRRLPYTGLIGTMDMGNTKKMHYQDKQDVGLRASILALRMVYEHGHLRTLGPMFQSARRKGDRFMIRFTGVQRGLKTLHGQMPNWFSIAGANRKFVAAQAKIIGDEVMVWSPQVKHPQAVRFALNSRAQPNLEDGAGMPVLPFRTDHWPLQRRRSWYNLRDQFDNHGRD